MSKIENTFELQLVACQIRGWEREHVFHPKRKWRFDFAWPENSLKIAVEIEGGIYTRGRHVRGRGFEDDCEKYNEALLLGWRVLRVTSKQVTSGLALQWVERALTLLK